MQKYSRTQEKKNTLSVLRIVDKEAQEFCSEENEEQFPYEGCYCSDCLATRRHEQSIRSRIINTNQSSSQNLGELILMRLLR